MKHITIDGNLYPVPDDCYHVAVDGDGMIYAYQNHPVEGNNFAACWFTDSFISPPGTWIGSLGYPAPDWKYRIYSFPQQEHSVKRD